MAAKEIGAVSKEINSLTVSIQILLNLIGHFLYHRSYPQVKFIFRLHNKNHDIFNSFLDDAQHKLMQFDLINLTLDIACISNEENSFLTLIS